MQQPNPQMFSNIPQSLAIMLVVYLFLTNFFLMKDQEPLVALPESAETTAQGSSGDLQGLNQVDLSKGVEPHSNVWKAGQRYEMKMYLDEARTPLSGEVLRSTSPLWHLKDMVYGDWDMDHTAELEIPVTEHLYNNGSYFAHFYFCKSGSSWPAAALNSESISCTTRVTALVLYQPPPKKVEKKGLLSEQPEAPVAVPEVAPASSSEWISFWKPNITLAIIYDETVFGRGKIPTQLSSQMRFTKRGRYFPPLYVNDFWLFRDRINPINRTLSTLPLSLEFYTLSMTKWSIYQQMQQSFEMQIDAGMAQSDSEIDEVKRMLLDTNPWLLGLTFAVSILHMVFDMLAFKNDISFWKNRKTTAGLSVRTIFLNLFCQIVIFLYLLDNETTWMIILSSGVGIAIEFWKITQACHVNRIPTFPFVSFKEKSTSSRTKKFDEQAMKYLSWALFPLIVGYAIYTLLYQEHKGWYSWILSTLTGAVYTFGFIMMTPQLFINYKHKSVKHLPWRVFTYKALNTFIDDLFAFIIKMPMLHRLACFRDDVIFFIYLYQRWIYRNNPQRPEDEDSDGEEEEEQQAVSTSSESQPLTDEQKDEHKLD